MVKRLNTCKRCSTWIPPSYKDTKCSHCGESIIDEEQDEDNYDDEETKIICNHKENDMLINGKQFCKYCGEWKENW